MDEVYGRTRTQPNRCQAGLQKVSQPVDAVPEPAEHVKMEVKGKDGYKKVWINKGHEKFEVSDGAIAIAAITSCTNTSNPFVMIGAGLVARKAREKGIDVKPWVKTSLAPGSKVVTDYLKKADLLGDLEALDFHLVGYGCTSCIGNSVLCRIMAKAADDYDVVLVSVLSGNRNLKRESILR